MELGETGSENNKWMKLAQDYIHITDPTVCVFVLLNVGVLFSYKKLLNIQASAALYISLLMSSISGSTRF